MILRNASHFMPLQPDQSQQDSPQLALPPAAESQEVGSQTTQPQYPSPARTSGSPKALEPGQLLMDLERRQDEVLEQLDDLDAKLKDVLKELGATLDDGEGEQMEMNPGRAAA